MACQSSATPGVFQERKSDPARIPEILDPSTWSRRMRGLPAQGKRISSPPRKRQEEGADVLSAPEDLGGGLAHNPWTTIQDFTIQPSR